MFPVFCLLWIVYDLCTVYDCLLRLVYCVRYLWHWRCACASACATSLSLYNVQMKSQVWNFIGGCEYGCDIGWFGDLCTGECRDSCRNKNCLDESDNCVEGCSDFYYGERCATLCNQFCTNHICDDYGYCTDGCLDGQFGDLCNATCDEMCIDNTCDRISGRCEYCLNSNSDTYFLCETASMYCNILYYHTK